MKNKFSLVLFLAVFAGLLVFLMVILSFGQFYQRTDEDSGIEKRAPSFMEESLKENEQEELPSIEPLSSEKAGDIDTLHSDLENASNAEAKESLREDSDASLFEDDQDIDNYGDTYEENDF